MCLYLSIKCWLFRCRKSHHVVIFKFSIVTLRNVGNQNKKVRNDTPCKLIFCFICLTFTSNTVVSKKKSPCIWSLIFLELIDHSYQSIKQGFNIDTGVGNRSWNNLQTQSQLLQGAGLYYLNELKSGYNASSLPTIYIKLSIVSRDHDKVKTRINLDKQWLLIW